MSNPLESLAFALEKYPERVEIAPLGELVTESARAKPQRPAYLKVAVPDDVVKALRGDPEKSDSLLFLVRIPRDVQQRSESSIILPGEIS